MHQALVALLGQDPVDTACWRSFWDQLSEDGLERGEAVALLASLSTRLPDHHTLASLLHSLDERRPEVTVQFPDTVNIVGTGGGPRTFNVSTAAAFVAAALGVRVVKTGSRAFASSCGSIDLLERLGVPLTKSYEHTGDTLERFGIAFAGYFVYPKELTLLARRVLPIGLRSFGRFLNSVGPFLAALPVSAQITGVSTHPWLPELRGLAGTVGERSVWLCANDVGADELVSFADNVIYTNDDGSSNDNGGSGSGSAEILLSSGQFVSDAGGIDDLRPVDAETGSSVVEHFLEVVSGNGGSVATRTISLNAAAMAVASGLTRDWAAAIAAAGEAIDSGAALDLVHRMRSPQRLPSAALVSKAGGGG